MNMSGSDGTPTAEQLRAQAAAHSAHNYHPLPVVIAEAEGAWVTDVAGRRYLDLLAAYSAVNFGHRHPRLVAAAQRQLERVTLVSRAFEHDQFAPFCAELAALACMEMVMPLPGFLAGVREICSERGALMIADEIQSGLGRTGTTFACEHDDVVPDVYVLGKALGGGIVPVSAVVSSREILGVFRPGQHGSTFGGNPLACAVGREVIAMLATGEFQERSAKLGAHMHDRLSALPESAVRHVRGRGLVAGAELVVLPGLEGCAGLVGQGHLGQDSH